MSSVTDSMASRMRSSVTSRDLGSQILRRLTVAGGRLPQVEVFQFALGVSHRGVGVEQRAAGTLQLPVVQFALLDCLELEQNLVIGLLEVFKLDAGRDGDEALLPVVDRRGKVAQRQLFPHIQKELGVAGPTEKRVAHQQRRGVPAAAGKAHAQLSLGHVHPLCHPQRLRTGRMGQRQGDLLNVLPGQRCKRLQQCLFHPFPPALPQ